MASVILSLVSKEDVEQGWNPGEDVYVHRISNEMRSYGDDKNVGHDLLISDPELKRPRHSSLEAVVLEEYQRNRSIVGISEAFLPVHDFFTKSMRKRVWSLDGGPLKDAFDKFFTPFEAALIVHKRPKKLRRGGPWQRDLTFADLALCLSKIRAAFGAVTTVAHELSSLEALFESVVVDALEAMWAEFEESKVQLNDRERARFETLKRNPLGLISQFACISSVTTKRNALSHPFTAGKDFDIERAKIELRVVEGVCAEEIAKDFREVLEFCVLNCKCALQKNEIELQQSVRDVEDMFRIVT